jgi:hypothetical protein
MQEKTYGLLALLMPAAFLIFVVLEIANGNI